MSYVKNSQQNRMGEKKHQNILNVGRTILYKYKLSKTYWSFSLQFATPINKVPTPILHHKSPYQIFHNKLPELNTFKVFASLCYASTLQAHGIKMDSKVGKSIFLGYKPGSKGYIFLDFHTNEVFVSINVIFHERILPYKSTSQSLHTSWYYFPSKHDNSPSIDQTNHVTLAQPTINHHVPDQHNNIYNISKSSLKLLANSNINSPKTHTINNDLTHT